MQQPITIYITQQSFHLFGEQEGGFCRSDAYSAVAVAKKVGSGSWAVYNIFRGHLGTITHLKNGSTINEYSFDAWGRRRDKDTWGYTLSSEPALFAGRGFTGHEHLTYFNLVNMNGRLYDPVVGRFLSPDENLQMPGFTQNFNRYSYALNNPLVYTDPNGESFLSALASGLSFGLYGLWQHNNAQKMGYNGFQSYLYAGGQTAIAAASAYLGSVVQIYGAIPSALFQSSVNVISNGLVNTLNKDPFFENWESGAISGLVFGGMSGYKNAQAVNELFEGMGVGARINLWTGDMPEINIFELQYNESLVAGISDNNYKSGPVNIKKGDRPIADIISRIKYLNASNGIKDLHEVVTPHGMSGAGPGQQYAIRTGVLKGKYDYRILQLRVTKLQLKTDPSYYKVRQDGHGLFFRSKGNILGLHMTNYLNKPLLTIQMYSRTGVWALKEYYNSISIINPFDISRFLNK